MDLALAVQADNYLQARTATYADRTHRFAMAAHALDLHGLTDRDIVLDVGAGATDFDYFLRHYYPTTTRVSGGFRNTWRGRYWPVDAWQGIDLGNWDPGRSVDFTVALEVIEHLPALTAHDLLERLQQWTAKAIVVSTPIPRTTDVLGMDKTHMWACRPEFLLDLDFVVEERSFYGQPADSLFAVWTP